MGLATSEAIGGLRSQLVGEIELLNRAESKDLESPRRRVVICRRKHNTPTWRAVRAARLLGSQQSRERRRELFRRAVASIGGETALHRLLPLLENLVRRHEDFLSMTSNGLGVEISLADSGSAEAINKLLWYLPPREGPTDQPADTKNRISVSIEGQKGTIILDGKPLSNIDFEACQLLQELLDDYPVPKGLTNDDRPQPSRVIKKLPQVIQDFIKTSQKGRVLKL